MNKKPEINRQIIIKAYKEYISLKKIANKNKYRNGWVFYRLREKYGEITTYLVNQLSNNPKMTIEQAQKIVEQKIADEREISKKNVDRFMQEEREKRNRVKSPTNKNLKENYNDERFKNDPREYVKGIRKCPHGLPYFKTCAICDPEKFRSENGTD